MERRFVSLAAAYIGPALAIIEAHNPEDAEVAEEGLGAWPGEDFVALVDGTVAGLTGARPIEDSDGAFWLSWTYMHAGFRRQGVGRWMLEQLIASLEARGARKLFVQVSDQIVAGVPIYADALRLYRRLGFKDEATHRGFYAAGESMLVLGLRLRPLATARAPLERRGARLTELFELAESEGAMGLDWRFARLAASKAGAARPFLDRAAELNLRVLFAAAPSNAPRVARLFRDSGFTEEGRLTDFYQDGVDELRLRYDLDLFDLFGGGGG